MIGAHGPRPQVGPGPLQARHREPQGHRRHRRHQQAAGQALLGGRPEVEPRLAGRGGKHLEFPGRAERLADAADAGHGEAGVQPVQRGPEAIAQRFQRGVDQGGEPHQEEQAGDEGAHAAAAERPQAEPQGRPQHRQRQDVDQPGTPERRGLRARGASGDREARRRQQGERGERQDHRLERQPAAQQISGVGEVGQSERRPGAAPPLAVDAVERQEDGEDAGQEGQDEHRLPGIGGPPQEVFAAGPAQPGEEGGEAPGGHVGRGGHPEAQGAPLGAQLMDDEREGAAGERHGLSPPPRQDRAPPRAAPARCGRPAPGWATAPCPPRCAGDLRAGRRTAAGPRR